MWARNYLYAPAEKRKLYSYSAPKARRVKEQKSPPKGRFYSFQTVGGTPPV